MTFSSRKQAGWNLASEAGRRWVSVCVIFLLLALLLILLPGTLLMIFAGLLLAILPRICGTKLGRLLHIPSAWGVALVLALGVAVIALGGVALAPSVSTQLDELWQQIPSSIDAIRSRVENYAWADSLIERIRETRSEERRVGKECLL